MIKRNEVPPELLAAAENYLNITWMIKPRTIKSVA